MCLPSETQDDDNWEHFRSLRPRDPLSFQYFPIPLPSSPESKCSLTLIRTGMMNTVPAYLFIHGSGDDDLFTMPVFAFLIEKNVHGSTERVLFELGLRPTEQHYKEFYRWIGGKWNIDSPSGTHKILEETGVPLDSISAIIFGHAHFDHIGNLSHFPPTTSVVVGPGSPIGLELAEEIDVDPRVIKERDVRQLSRELDTWVDVGCLKGFDYFGDGSFWLLDTPGHKEGHMTALVRTSTSPPTYHLLGSDVGHTISLINSPATQFTLAGYFTESWEPTWDRTKVTSMHLDLAVAYESMARVGRMDMEDGINVCLAHDYSMDLTLPPGDIVRLDGTREELSKLKARDWSRISRSL